MQISLRYMIRKIKTLRLTKTKQELLSLNLTNKIETGECDKQKTNLKY